MNTNNVPVCEPTRTIKDNVIEQREMLVNLVERLGRIANEMGCESNRQPYEDNGVSNLNEALINDNNYIHICHEIVSEISCLLGI